MHYAQSALRALAVACLGEGWQFADHRDPDDELPIETGESFDEVYKSFIGRPIKIHAHSAGPEVRIAALRDAMHISTETRLHLVAIADDTRINRRFVLVANRRKENKA